MFGKPLRGEAFRHQVGDRCQTVIVDQYVLAILLIHAAGERRFLLCFLLGRFLFLLWIARTRGASDREWCSDGENGDKHR